MRTQTTRRKTVQHFESPGTAHELTFSCYKNRPFLDDAYCCGLLVEAIEKARIMHSFDVWAYVFMPTHVHLLIFPWGDRYSISDILLSFKQSVSRRMLIHVRKYEPTRLEHFTTGQKHTPYRFWQDGPGYDRNVTSAITLEKMADYIHANPVRKGLVESAEKWRWSSVKDWTDAGTGPLKIDRKSFPVD